MRIAALFFPFFVIVFGLIQAAASQPAIVRDLDASEVEHWFSSLSTYHRDWQSTSTLFLPLAGAAIQDISIPKIEELKEAVNQIVSSAGAIKTLQNIDLKKFKRLSRVFKTLQNEFSEPLPEDKTERYKRQETMVTQAFEKIVDTVVDVCRTWDIPEDTVRADFDKIKPHLIRTLLIATNLVNKHPDLALLIFSPVIIRIIPKGVKFLLRPILRTIGFGCRGPVKGSIAARAQSLFFGAKVPKGSLFAWLQSVGMKKKGEGFAMILKFFRPF